MSKNNNRTSRLSQMNDEQLAEELEKKYLLMVQRQIIPKLQYQDEVEALKALSQQYIVNKNNITGFLDEIRDLIEDNERLFVENETLKSENEELEGSKIRLTYQLEALNFKLARLEASEGDVRDSLNIMEIKYLNGMTMQRHFSKDEIRQSYSQIMPAAK